MAFLALRIGVHPSSLGGYARGVGSAATGKDMAEAMCKRDRRLCRCCGLAVPFGSVPYFIDGDRRHTESGNLALACPSCVLVQGAGRYTATAEIMPIWLPEMSQRSLNRLVASLHEAAVPLDLPVHFAAAPKHDSSEARQILKIWGGLVERRAVLFDIARIGTIAGLVDLCLDHDPVNGFAPEDLAHGLRFLHRGRFYADGDDIYPEIVAHRIRSRLAARAAAPAMAA